MDKEGREKEERKENVGGIRMKFIGNEEEVQGRERVEKERKGGEVETEGVRFGLVSPPSEIKTLSAFHF